MLGAPDAQQRCSSCHGLAVLRHHFGNQTLERRFDGQPTRTARRIHPPQASARRLEPRSLQLVLIPQLDQSALGQEPVSHQRLHARDFALELLDRQP
jgi:hypothetical protein